MRRYLAALLVPTLLWSSLPLPADAAQSGPAASSPATTAGKADPLALLLDERALKESRNPVVASFLAGEGATLVPEELRERALVQLRGALKRQTSFMGLMLA